MRCSEANTLIQHGSYKKDRVFTFSNGKSYVVSQMSNGVRTHWVATELEEDDIGHTDIIHTNG